MWLHKTIAISKFCVPKCTVSTDCGILQDTSYAITLEPKFGKSYNGYNSDILFRGTTCTDLEGAPHVGEDDRSGDKYCIFNCPDNFAMMLDENGKFDGCASLPNYNGDVNAGTVFVPDYGESSV